MFLRSELKLFAFVLFHSRSRKSSEQARLCWCWVEKRSSLHLSVRRLQFFIGDFSSSSSASASPPSSRFSWFLPEACRGGKTVSVWRQRVLAIESGMRHNFYGKSHTFHRLLSSYLAQWLSRRDVVCGGFLRRAFFPLEIEFSHSHYVEFVIHSTLHQLTARRLEAFSVYPVNRC